MITLAVSKGGIPWKSPVYFVYWDHRFYFFSNKNSKHILQGLDKNQVAASIFNDSDQIDQIFGLQMGGVIELVSRPDHYLTVVKKYTHKFDFLKQAFGSQIIENRDFFLEKFKSHLYKFNPENIFLSDNSNSTDKRKPIDLNDFE